MDSGFPWSWTAPGGVWGFCTIGYLTFGVGLFSCPLPLRSSRGGAVRVGDRQPGHGALRVQRGGQGQPRPHPGSAWVVFLHERLICLLFSIACATVLLAASPACFNHSHGVSGSGVVGGALHPS